MKDKIGITHLINKNGIDALHKQTKKTEMNCQNMAIKDVKHIANTPNKISVFWTQ
jgi:hypothetical protein